MNCANCGLPIHKVDTRKYGEYYRHDAGNNFGKATCIWADAHIRGTRDLDWTNLKYCNSVGAPYIASPEKGTVATKCLDEFPFKLDKVDLNLAAWDRNKALTMTTDYGIM